jgi:hypothetical protein
MHPEVVGPAGRMLAEALPGELFKQGFYLGGGTGLALQLGHRRSEDFDFFCPDRFDVPGLERMLEPLPGYAEVGAGRDTLHCRVGDVKLSFIFYPVGLRFALLSYGRVPVADWRDILAEKLKTASQRGSRKDFYDIHACCTLRETSPREAVGLLRARFEGTGLNLYHVARSLVWFKDADSEPDPVFFKPADWNEVKAFFVDHLPEFEAALLGDSRPSG